MRKGTEDKLKAVKRFKTIRNIFIIVVVVGTLLFALFRFVIGAKPVSGVSMYPTLEDGDFVIFSRVDRSFQYGDVVALQLPTGENYVKRIVALGGDTVNIVDGIFYRNGEAIDDMLTLEEDGGLVFPLVVPEGDVFTLGDNRTESIDSRFYGTISIRQIQGVLKIRFHGFSISKIH